MRRALTVVLLVVVGCSSATAETTSTVGGEAAAATTTTSVTTTTQPGTTTVAEEECTETQGGFAVTERGFVCPPHLMAAETFNTLGQEPTYLAGTYELRLFEPRFEFTRTESFRSSGDSRHLAELDLLFPSGMWVVSSEVAVGLDPARLEGEEWVTELTVEDIDLFGVPATRVQFSTERLQPRLLLRASGSSFYGATKVM